MSGILDTFFNLSYMLQVVPDILRVGYYNTITISLYSTIIGIIIRHQNNDGSGVNVHIQASPSVWVAGRIT